MLERIELPADFQKDLQNKAKDIELASEKLQKVKTEFAAIQFAIMAELGAKPKLYTLVTNNENGSYLLISNEEIEQLQKKEVEIKPLEVKENTLKEVESQTKLELVQPASASG